MHPADKPPTRITSQHGFHLVVRLLEFGIPIRQDDKPETSVPPARPEIIGQ